MTALIRFSAELGAWIANGLEQGWSPPTLILMLIEERLDAGIARALVEGFVAARKSGQPFPVGHLIVEKVALGDSIAAWSNSDAHTSWRTAITMVSDARPNGEN